MTLNAMIFRDRQSRRINPNFGYVELSLQLDLKHVVLMIHINQVNHTLITGEALKEMTFILLQP